MLQLVQFSYSLRERRSHSRFLVVLNFQRFFSIVIEEIYLWIISNLSTTRPKVSGNEFYSFCLYQISVFPSHKLDSRKLHSNNDLICKTKYRNAIHRSNETVTEIVVH